MRTNYVLIDFENVQPASLAGLDAEHFRVLVFVGENQNKVSFETADALQRLGSRAAYVKITGNGANALDFHIAFHIGNLAAQDASAFFHIISKDTGFDPLIEHLKKRNVFACRSKDITDIPLLKAGNLKSIAEKVEVVIANLQHRGESKPRTVKALTSTINSVFHKQLTDEEILALLNCLQTQGYITVNDDKVTYAWPHHEA